VPLNVSHQLRPPPAVCRRLTLTDSPRPFPGSLAWCIWYLPNAALPSHQGEPEREGKWGGHMGGGVYRAPVGTQAQSLALDLRMDCGRPPLARAPRHGLQGTGSKARAPRHGLQGTGSKARVEGGEGNRGALDRGSEALVRGPRGRAGAQGPAWLMARGACALAGGLSCRGAVLIACRHLRVIAKSNLPLAMGPSPPQWGRDLPLRPQGLPQELPGNLPLRGKLPGRYG